ncbi:hypothetical protein KY290_024547 [Solanum tuberosum]|uniref:Uncharacterized protein n=1 Tax=Solanum tuberosum TaxID=4113 RepID=A0ABQ7UR15_SOLTU|nr:hypothetical protein KY289_023664 [Solanum tuberosum]KAH0672313.1 hypothetical protein KY284_023400 [Solanum tuberosum]KAH0675528.1 hypothetical protein KY285_023329 [Solanum tuberosum]KAH0754277.1 hypothetical protein KY290_024547 [Solanum tuberosum]
MAMEADRNPSGIEGTLKPHNLHLGYQQQRQGNYRRGVGDQDGLARMRMVVIAMSVDIGKQRKNIIGRVSLIYLGTQVILLQ